MGIVLESDPFNLSMGDLLNAAGLRWKSLSYASMSPECERVIFTYKGEDITLPGREVIPWLQNEGLFPSAADVKICALARMVQQNRTRLDAMQDHIYALRRSLCVALRGQIGEPVLCYVSDGVAWFTTDLDRQWGDDWNDAPYEHNAGSPYEWMAHRAKYQPPYFVVPVSFVGPWVEPCDGHLNSPYTVEQINTERLQWLISDGGNVPSIYAGTPLSMFQSLVEANGGSWKWIDAEHLGDK